VYLYKNQAIYGLKTGVFSGGKLQWWAHEGKDLSDDGSSTVTAGLWSHVLVTWDESADTAKFYIDGVLNSTKTDATIVELVSGDAQLIMGGIRNNDGTLQELNGKLDDIRLYNRILQAHEIFALAAGHQPATASGTFTLDANLAIANDLVIAAGNLDVSGTSKSVTLSGSWLNYGGQFTPRAGTVTFEGASGTETLQSGGQAFTNLTINNSSSWTLSDLLDIDGVLTLSSGTLDASASNYSLHAYDFDQSGGTFTARSGLVVLDGSSNVTSTITSTLNELQIEDPTEDGLIAYWKFDECQTDTTVDSSGNSQTGTLNGPAVWTGSVLPAPIDFDNSCALSFDGSDDQFVESASNSTLTGNATFSIALWFYVPTGANTDGAYGRFVDWGTAIGGQSAQISVYASTINQLFVGHWSTGQASTTTFSNDEWHHAVWVREGGSNNGHQGNTLYLDGVEIPLDINVNTAKTINVTADKYDIGGRGSGNLSVECTLDDVRVYNRVLTPIEVRRLANGQYANGALSTATYTLGGNLDLDTMTILSGVVGANSRTIDISGDWNNYAGSGAFTKGTSTVDLDGSSTQNIRGSTEFYNLEASTTAAQTILFGSGTTQFVTNALTLTGTVGKLLTLGPLTTAIDWLIDLSSGATQTLNYLSVSYSDASNGDQLNACSDSTDGGNTTNWDFACTSTTTTANGNGGWNSNKQAIAKSQGSGTDGGKVVINDSESPTLSAVGIADDVTQATKIFVGGILDPSMRTFITEDPSRRVKEVFDALVRRFNDGIIEFRTAQNESAESLMGSALEDTERRMMRADRKVADRFSDILTADAIGERRGLLVATVKSEQVVFADVPIDSWFAPFVSSVISEKIATGYEDENGKPTGQFGAVNPVTLAESLKMSLQAASIELNAGTPRNTSAQGTWSSAYVAQAESMKLDVFAPDRNVNESATRAEVVHTILQVLGLPVAPNSSSPFTDLPENHKYAKSISTAYLYGIMTGDTDAEGNALGTVRPDETINRAEVSKMIALIKDLFNQ